MLSNGLGAGAQNAPDLELRNCGGSVRSCASQSRTSVSSSVAAGDAIQLNPMQFRAALSMSPRSPAVLLPAG